MNSLICVALIAFMLIGGGRCGEDSDRKNFSEENVKKTQGFSDIWNEEKNQGGIVQ